MDEATKGLRGFSAKEMERRRLAELYSQLIVLYLLLIIFPSFADEV